MEKESPCQQPVSGDVQIPPRQQESADTSPNLQQRRQPSRSSYSSRRHHRPSRNRHRWEMRLGRYARFAAMVLLLLCLCGLPLLWGGRHPFAIGAAGLCILTAGLLWITSVVFHGSVRLQPAKGALFFVLLCLVGLLQLLPSFSALVMDGQLLSYWQMVLQAGVTQYEPILAVLPSVHRETLLIFGMAALMYVLLCQLFADSREHLVLLAMSIAGAAGLCALLSIIQHFGGDQWFLWVYKTPGQSLSGPYFNKNHLAQLQEMGLFVSLGLVLALVSARRGSWLAGWASKRQRLIISCLAGFCFVVCSAALIFTLSRAGILCAAAGLAIYLCVLFVSRARKSISLPVLLLVAVLLLASFYGLDIVTSRLELALSGEDPSGLSRQEMWRTMREVIALSPWWGTGFGSVRTLAPLFDLSYMPGFVTYDAHNDYIELAISVGLPCACLFLLAAAFCLFKGIRALMNHHVRRSSLFPLLLGVLVAIVVPLGHEFFDYGLKQSANLLVFAALVVIFAGLVRQKEQASVYREDGEAEGHSEARVVARVPSERDITAGASSGTGDRWRLGRAWYCLPVLALVPAVALGALYAGRLATGRELVRLDVLQYAPEVHRAFQPESLVTALVRQADKVLARDSENLAALNTLAAAHMQKAALLQTNLLANELTQILERPVSQAQVWRKPYRPYLVQAYAGIALDKRFAVAAEYAMAAAAYARMAVANPLNGLTYAAMGHAVEEAAAWRSQKTASLETHSLALALYPTHVLVLKRAMEGLWHVWQEEPDQVRRQQLANQALELARLYSIQRQNMAWVYPMLWQMGQDRSILVAMADTSIRGQEYLAEFLMDRGFWQEAWAALDQMEALNLARPDEENPETLGIRGFLTRERRGKLVLERRILQKKVQVMTQLGETEQVALLQERLLQVRHQENTPRLDRVDSLMAQGKYLQAEEVLNTMPEDARALVRLGEILFVQGRYERLSRVMLKAQELESPETRERLAALERCVRERLGEDVVSDLREREKAVQDLEQQSEQGAGRRSDL